MDPIILVSSVFESVESQAYPDSDGITGLTSVIALATFLYEANLLAHASGAFPWVATVLTALPISPMVLFYGALAAVPAAYLATQEGMAGVLGFFAGGLCIFSPLLPLLPSSPDQLFPMLSCAFLSYAFGALVALPAIRHLKDPTLVSEAEKVAIEWKRVPWQEWRERVVIGKIFLTLGLVFTSSYLYLPLAALQAYTFTVMARRKWVDLTWEESIEDERLWGFGFQTFKIHQSIPFLIQSNQTCTCPSGHKIADSPEDLSSKIETLWREFAGEMKVKEKTLYRSSRSKEHVCEVELPKDHAISCPECEHPFDRVDFKVVGYGVVGASSRRGSYVKGAESITWVSAGGGA